MRHQDALALLARETRRARLGLGIERAVAAGFWLLAAVGAWAGLALAGLHALAPALAQSLSAIAALAAFATLAWQARRRWRAPTEAEARARLAADSHFESGAFEALRDRPSRYDAFSTALWRKEQEHAVARAEKARARPMRFRLDDTDPYKLRYVLIAALAVAVLLARDEAGDRLARAFLPDPGPLLGDQAMAIEAWLTPAEYTRAPPLSLSDVVGQEVATPPGVQAMVRVTGPTGAPRLVFRGQGGRRTSRFMRAADGAWEARMDVPGAGRLSIVRFHTRAFWRLSPALDANPRVAFTAPITLLPDERATIAWRASDDFGVRRLALRMRPLEPPPGLVRADPVDIELESPAGDPQQAEAETEVDLSWHPYAGMKVEARIVAFDALGQEGASDPLHITLPEKVFLQSLARAAIEIRRQILAERRPYRVGRMQAEALPQAPAGVRRAARLLDGLTVAPQDGYFRDLAVFLGLRLARSELGVARAIADTDRAADTLWRTALRAEYGGAADARRALEEAQRQLADALQSGAPQERVRQLFEALRRAADAYMEALVQEALRNGETANLEDTQEQTEIGERDIEELLQQAQRLSEQGRTAEAQQILQMLAGLLANLDVQLSQGEGEGDRSQDEQMQQSMDELSQSIGEQRELNSDTQQADQQNQGQGGGGTQQGGQGGGALAERQAQIRQGLAEAQSMAEDSGVAPSEDLNAAGEAMRQAENALRRGDFQGAQAAQTAALDRLREGAESLAAEMRVRGREGEQGQAGEAGSRDPLGRAAAGGNGGSETQVPTTADPVRAREILDDILERAQDPNRPEAEREYLRRLLDRFGDS